MAKSYIKLWDSYESYFEPLGAAEVGRLVLAMMKYKSSGVEPEFSGSEKFIWPAIKRDLDEDIAYTNKKAASGKAGGEAHKSKQTEANESTLKQTKAGRRTKDVGLRTKDKEISPIGETEKAANAAPAPVKPETARFKSPKLDEVQTYFAEKGGTAGQAERFFAYYESNGWRVGKNPMKNWKAAVTGWLARDRDEKRQTAKPAQVPYNVDDVINRALQSLDEEYEVIG